MKKLIAFIIILKCCVGLSLSPQNNLSAEIPTNYILPGSYV